MCGPQPYRKSAFAVQLRAGHARPLPCNKKRTSANYERMSFLLFESFFDYFLLEESNQPGCLPM